MAKFRRQHGSSSRGKGAFSGRLISIFFIMLAMVVGTLYYAKSDRLPTDSGSLPDYNLPEDRYFIPSVKNGTLVHHRHYSLSYDESAEQAEWVAYYLTKASLQKKNVPRAKRFNVDPLVSSQSARHGDYIRSGYDRGHLVPAADMAFDVTAMKETFYMSNISPQIRNFNGAVWRELEETVRDWAYKFDGLYIVSGPVFGDASKRIGKSKVLVPDAFFKVVLDLESRNKKGVAFLLDNHVNYDHLSESAISIDELEELTGFNFFDQLLEDDVEDQLESKFEVRDWPFSKKRFDLRNTKWNRLQPSN